MTGMRSVDATNSACTLGMGYLKRLTEVKMRKDILALVCSEIAKRGECPTATIGEDTELATLCLGLDGLDKVIERLNIEFDTHLSRKYAALDVYRTVSDLVDAVAQDIGARDHPASRNSTAFAVRRIITDLTGKQHIPGHLTINMLTSGNDMMNVDIIMQFEAQFRIKIDDDRDLVWVDRSIDQLIDHIHAARTAPAV
jgi:acyl carrier protein